MHIRRTATELGSGHSSLQPAVLDPVERSFFRDKYYTGVLVSHGTPNSLGYWR